MILLLWMQKADDAIHAMAGGLFSEMVVFFPLLFSMKDLSSHVHLILFFQTTICLLCMSQINNVP
jgi:hypothetical protein